MSFEVPVIDNPGREDFMRIVRAGQPVIVRGATEKWPALGEWSPAYIREKSGHRVVPIEFYPGGSWYGQWTTVSMRLDRYIDILESEGAPEMCYLAQAKVDEYLPELVDDVPVPAVLDGQDGIGAGAFLGRDSITALHYHSRDEALLCQISGRKKVVLYAPEDYRNLRYAHPFSYRFNFSDMDLSGEPETRYARLRRARPYECVLEQGDALFIPLFWSHVTENQGLSASVTFFWRSVDNTWTPLSLALRSRLGFWFRSQVSGRVVGGIQKLFGYPAV
ncbi:cupin-like domain-containing protein [Rhizohabitans arisaemae]|uniref:cupin-like domain-containing protein n=1 Tax=Rhizohabitans arisaemae TaxID=2720610 RepID=UPI0024B1687D|nr:cupin-like domain-containing protein [Rhizohabitans arisaemae]